MTVSGKQSEGSASEDCNGVGLVGWSIEII